MEWSRNVSRYEIGYFRHCAKIFGTVRLFRKKNLNRFFLAGPPVRIIITARNNYDAYGQL